MQPESGTQEQDYLLVQLEAMAVARVAPPAQSQFIAFLRQYYEMASLDVLRQRTPTQLLETAHAHWQSALRREAGHALVEVLRPSAGTQGLATLRTCVEDMPFIVDSVSMVVREAGSFIDWAVHPVLRVRRSADGVMEQVFPPFAETAQPESLMHLEFEPLGSPEAYDALEQRLAQAFADLRIVVADFEPMLARLDALVEVLEAPRQGGDPEAYAEAREFLRWLREDRFTFLGYAETRAEMGPNGRLHFVLTPERALGLARPGKALADPDALIAPKQELDRYAESHQLVVVTKANARAPVRHPEYMDVISVKRFREDGTLLGTHRFLGLLSSEAYLERPRNIPLIRRKVAYVLKRSRLPERSHTGKLLHAILHQLPRDDLFQMSEEELFALCTGIRSLRDRHQLRLFMRRDRYGRFYSFLVYLPREKYSRELRDRISQELLELCNGSAVERSVEFPRGFPARIHVVVRTPPGTRIPLSATEVEQRLIAATRSWRDQLRELWPDAVTEEGAALFARFADAFPSAYVAANSPREAAADLQFLLRLSEDQPLLPRLQLNEQGRPAVLKLYTWGRPVALSEVMPTLEHFGLRVIRQEPTEIAPKDAPVLWLQEFAIQAAVSEEDAPEAIRARFEDAFLLCWRGLAETDGLNRLVLAAALDARQVSALRMLTRYLLQTSLPFSQSFMEGVLAEYAPLARLLLRLFETRFDPRMEAGLRRQREQALTQAIEAHLDHVASLEDDRVLRAFLAVIHASLRTNYFQRRADRSPKPWISVKLDPARIPDLPQPRPAFEIFVYAPEVEGIHLRGGKVARGGLRWSDRRQDFRTEVLGLMKAQRVKNAIIVPVGAKGGFVVKQGDPTQRESWQQQGIACYKTFVRGLLDVTDNLVAGTVVPPPETVCYDGDDPYLVVAADKGTASFSDIANGLAAEYGFWLGDAFASGGSAGYDHKKMGITARGAWECVKRHFRELGRDIQREDFTVVGIGDMSGDVFGNGMLLSRHIRLIAAFDHRHIFIDPNPDPERSFQERERLFRLPRSSWADYDPALLSPGGAVYARNQKSIQLSSEAQTALGVDASALTPPQLLAAILRAPVDLLWNGGIGTFVKATRQSHADVGDRGNDAYRINAAELRCKVVGEGGNLGFTQLARVEYALRGGRINTDAIDNAGGVHTSDREVNIKIPLNQWLRDGRLERTTRDPVLATLTDEIARAVLIENDRQALVLSLLEQNAPARLEDHAGLMRRLEHQGLLNRVIEFLPDDEVLKQRRREGHGMTRPELAVLLAYSKISLYDALLASNVPDDPSFEHELLAYFPAALIEPYREAFVTHPLRREIIATQLTNEVIDRMGPVFVTQLAEDEGATPAEVVRAYAAAARIFDAARSWAAIEAAGDGLAATVQYGLYELVQALLREATRGLVQRLARRPESLVEVTGRYVAGVSQLETVLSAPLPAAYELSVRTVLEGLRQSKVPAGLSEQLAPLGLRVSALDLVDLADEAQATLPHAAATYFAVGEQFQLPWLLQAVQKLPASGRWQGIARNQLREDIFRAHRRLAANVLARPEKDFPACLERWLAQQGQRLRPWQERLQELQSNGAPDFPALSVVLRQLLELAELTGGAAPP